MRKGTLLLVLVIALVGPNGGFARLAPSSFSQLIADSELIIEATPIAIQRTGIEAGRARLRILRVLRGSFEGKEITIAWGDEVHDQAIETIEFDRLLFLKKGSDGAYQGTQYGRSYWPFTSRIMEPRRVELESEARGFEYVYPLTMVRFTPDQRRRLFERKPSQAEGERRELISMRRLIAYLDQTQPKKR